MREHQWENLSLSVDANGVALLTMDVKGRADNAFTPGFLADLAGAVAHVKDNADICGLARPRAFAVARRPKTCWPCTKPA